MGDFKNAGQAWVREPIAVNVHDFPGDAYGRAVPYGVYDITTNRGFIYLGTSGDTPAFAVDAIAAWWQKRRPRHLAGRPPLGAGRRRW